MSDYVKTKDGINLFVNDWTLPSETKAVGSVMIVHGICEHCLRYDHVAKFFNSLGFHVRAYDQRGAGRSEGKRSFLPSDNILVEDLQMMFNSYSKSMQGKGLKAPLILGHSMGGCVTAAAVTNKLIEPSGMILSSPGLQPKLSTVKKYLLKMLLLISPDLGVPAGLPMNKITHDLYELKKALKDKYNHGTITARIINFMIREGAIAIEKARNIKAPTLLLVSGDDAFVVSKASQDFYNNIPHGLGKIHLYKNLYHELFNEIPEEREKVFLHLKEWLEEKILVENNI
jgi:alpha-beta hydrolase superfamily lysophospholipase